MSINNNMTRTEKYKAMMLHHAEVIDAWRVAPRAVLVFYGFMIYEASMWFMGIETPSTAQMGFISTLWGSAALLFNFYAKSGRAWGPQIEWDNIGGNDYLLNQKSSFYRGRERTYPTSRNRSRTRSRTQDDKDYDEEEDG